jgi:hypothetical protein
MLEEQDVPSRCVWHDQYNVRDSRVQGVCAVRE